MPQPMSKRTGTDDGSFYAAYLVRVWRLKSEGAIHWRVVLVDPQTGVEQRLDSLEALVPFLRAGALKPPAAGSLPGDGED